MPKHIQNRRFWSKSQKSPGFGQETPNPSGNSNIKTSGSIDLGGVGGHFRPILGCFGAGPYLCPLNGSEHLKKCQKSVKNSGFCMEKPVLAGLDHFVSFWTNFRVVLHDRDEEKSLLWPASGLFVSFWTNFRVVLHDRDGHI